MEDGRAQQHDATADATGVTRAQLLRRAAVGAVGLTGLGTALAACGDSSGGGASSGGASTAAGTGSTTTPKLGGTLTFAGFSDEDGAKIARPFLTKNGITLKATYVAGNDDMLTKLKTGGTSTIDVLTLNKDYSATEIAAGFVRPLDMERIPAAADLFAAFQDAPWTHVDGEVYGVPLIWGDEPCIYQPDKVSELPPAYTDFADPKFKGKLTTLDDAYSNIWLFSKSLGNPDPARITKAQLDQVLDALLAFKKNVVSLSASFGDMTDLLVRGDAAIAINGWAAMTGMAKPKGVTLKAGVPSKDGTYYWSDAYYITSEAPNVDAAYAYINHMTEAKQNAAIATLLLSGCTNEQALPLMDESVSGLYDFGAVKQPSADGPLGQGILPPLEPDGDITGVAEWQAAWQEFKVA